MIRILKKGIAESQNSGRRIDALNNKSGTMKTNGRTLEDQMISDV
jgi:hypothetical protein